MFPIQVRIPLEIGKPHTLEMESYIFHLYYLFSVQATHFVRNLYIWPDYLFPVQMIFLP